MDQRRQRAHRPPRVPFGRPISVKPDGESQDSLQLSALNLSLGGMFVAAKDAVPLGTRVSLALAAGGRMLDFAEAEVVWVQPATGFGVRFTKLRPRARSLVEHMVARGGTGEQEAVEPKARLPRRRQVAVAGAMVVGVCAAALGLHALGKPRPLSPPSIVAAPSQAVPLSPSSSAAPALTATAPTPPAGVYPGEFQVTLPTGGVTALRISVTDAEIAVTPLLHRGSAIRHVFKLASPPRLVIDVAGRQPRYSWQLDGSAAVKSVRVGARNRGTRVVVDLHEPLDISHMTYRVVTPGGV